MNSLIGTASVPLRYFIENKNEQKLLALELLNGEGTGVTTAAGLKSMILLKGKFTTYKELKSNFWKSLAKQYDHDDNGCINRVELETMLESIGSTLSEERISKLVNSLIIVVCIIWSCGIRGSNRSASGSVRRALCLSCTFR